MSKHRTDSGFTLIELLIVLVVLGILAAMALPSFLNQVRKGRRADAMDALEKVQLAEAAWRANHPAYATNLATLGLAATSAGGYYAPITIVSAATMTFRTLFTATASATGSQASDSDCQTFAIDENGPDTSGTYADDECWRR